MKKINLRKLALTLIFILTLTSWGGADKKENLTKEEAKTEEVQQTNEKSKEEAEEGKLIFEDVLGRTIELDKPLEKVIIQGSGSGGPFMQMMYLDKDNFYKKIAAMDDGLRQNRNDLYQRLVEKIPELEDLRRVTNFTDNDFSIEDLLSIDADGIIAPVSY